MLLKYIAAMHTCMMLMDQPNLHEQTMQIVTDNTITVDEGHKQLYTMIILAQTHAFTSGHALTSVYIDQHKELIILNSRFTRVDHLVTDSEWPMHNEIN